MSDKLGLVERNVSHVITLFAGPYFRGDTCGGALLACAIRRHVRVARPGRPYAGRWMVRSNPARCGPVCSGCRQSELVEMFGHICI